MNSQQADGFIRTGDDDRISGIQFSPVHSVDLQFSSLFSLRDQAKLDSGRSGYNTGTGLQAVGAYRSQCDTVHFRMNDGPAGRK